MKHAPHIKGIDLKKGRIYLFTGLGILLAVLVVLNRNALLHHPSQVRTPPPPARALPGGDIPVTNATFAIFDTETTGVDPATDRIVELGVVTFRDGQVLEERNWLLNPERFIPEEVQKVHGIHPEMVFDAPRFADIYSEFLDFTHGCVFVAHNARFDVNFVKAETDRMGVPAPDTVVLDSLGLFRAWFPGLESHGLEALAKHLKIDDEAFHRAKSDCLYVGRILEAGVRAGRADLTVTDLFKASGGGIPF